MAKLTFRSKVAKIVERSNELELDNMALYRCLAAKTKDQIMESFFKHLSKHEGEHAKLLAEMIGIEKPYPPEVSCSDDDRENMSEAYRREKTPLSCIRPLRIGHRKRGCKRYFAHLTGIESEYLIVSSTYG